MSSPEGARLLERLLEDPGFRARFRSDPAAAAREAGLGELAADLAGAEAPFETLELRESRSSVAGMMLATAAEGLGLFELSEHVLPQLGAEDALAADQPERSGAPADQGAAPSPPADPDDLSEVSADEPQSGDGATDTPASDAETDGPPSDEGDDGEPDGEEPDEEEPDEEEPDEEEPDEEEPDEEEPDEEEPDEEEPDEEEPDEVGPDADDLSDDENVGDGSDSGGEPDDSSDSGGDSGDSADPDDGDGDGDGDDGDDDDDESGSRSGEPPPQLDGQWKPDPDQYGMAGGGGPQSPIDAAVLRNPRITVDANGKQDFAKGRMDPRLGTVLLRLAETHEVSLSATTSDHPQGTAGGSTSNHWYGRALDIATVDGEIVRPGSAAGRALATELAKLDPSIRPDEIGSPWAISAPGFFSDADHQDHIHVAFDHVISADWEPPTDARVMPALRSDQVDNSR